MVVRQGKEIHCVLDANALATVSIQSRIITVISHNCECMEAICSSNCLAGAFLENEYAPGSSLYLRTRRFFMNKIIAPKLCKVGKFRPLPLSNPSIKRGICGYGREKGTTPRLWEASHLRRRMVYAEPQSNQTEFPRHFLRLQLRFFFRVHL